MTREGILALFDQQDALWKAQDAAAFAALYHANCVVESPIFGTVKGRAAVEASYRDLFRVFGDWRYEPKGHLIDGDHAAQLFTVYATHRQELFGVAATGRRFELKGVLFFHVEDGLIRHERRFYDFSGLLIQLGVLKAKPGA